MLPETLTSRVGFLLGRAAAAAQQMATESLAELGISGREYGVMALIHHDPSVGQTALGASLGIDRTTTVAVLSALENRALIERVRDPADRRRYQLTLTHAGDQTRRAAYVRLGRCDQRLLRPLSTTKRAELRQTLNILIAGL